MTALDGTDPGVSGVVALAYRLIASALQYRTMRADGTRYLRDLRHNNDLVPAVTETVRLLLDGLARDTNIVYDIQGLFDHGVDSIVRLTTTNSSLFVGMQIKSHREIAKEDISNKLLLQYSNAIDHYGESLRFFVLVFADLTEPGIRDRVRNIQATFVKKRHAIVIDPGYAATFLSLRPTQLDSLVTRVQRTGDPVVEAAQGELLDLHPVSAALILRLVSDLVGGRGSLSIGEVKLDSWIALVGWRSRRAAQIVWRGLYADDFDKNDLAGNTTKKQFPRNRNRYFDPYKSGVAVPFDLHGLTPGELGSLLGPYRGRPFETFDDELAEAFDELYSSDIIVIDQLNVRIDPSTVPGLIALAAEGRVRHEVSGSELVDYLVSVVLI